MSRDILIWSQLILKRTVLMEAIRTVAAIKPKPAVTVFVLYDAQTGSWAGKVRQQISTSRLPTIRPEWTGTSWLAVCTVRIKLAVHVSDFWSARLV
jgi:hypothetical protein